MTIRCNQCGSDQVEQARWVDANTGALGDFINYGETGSFCQGCNATCVALDDTQEPTPTREPCECDDDVVPGACFPFNGQAEVQRCDLCKRFSSDSEAADAVVAVLNAAAKLGLVLVPDVTYAKKVTPDGCMVGHQVAPGCVYILDEEEADRAHSALLAAFRVGHVLGRVVDAIHEHELAGHVAHETLVEADDLVRLVRGAS